MGKGRIISRKEVKKITVTIIIKLINNWVNEQSY